VHDIFYISVLAAYLCTPFISPNIEFSLSRLLRRPWPLSNQLFLWMLIQNWTGQYASHSIFWIL